MKLHTIIHRFLSSGLIASLLATLMLSACSKSDNNEAAIDEKIINIAVSTTPLSAPFYIAESQGYFKAHGLSVNLIDTIGGHRCLNAVLDGEVDLGTVSDYPIMMKSFSHDNYAIAATFVSSDNDVKIISRKSLGITKAKDLKGKKIGTIKGTSSHFFLDRFLLFNDLRLDDVSVVNLDPLNMAKALKNAEVDAIASWEPYGYLTKSMLGDDAVVFPANHYYRETFNLVGTKSYLSKNTQVIENILKALHQAITFIETDQKEAQSILVSRLKLDNNFINWIWDDFHFNLSLDQSLVITLENEAAWASENNIIKDKKKTNFLTFFDFAAMKKISPDSITIIH